MARKLTTSLQRSGWRFLRERTLKAHTERDVYSDAPSALLRQEKGVLSGLAITTFITIIAVLLAVMVPKPTLGKDTFFYTKNGGRFLLINNVLHPVTNVASARLIVGKPIKATTVNDDALQGVPVGNMVGLPSAPDILTTGTVAPRWSVCSQDNDNALTLTVNEPTSLYVTDRGFGVASSVSTIVRETTSEGDTVFWILDKAGKREYNPKDTMLNAALGIHSSILNKVVDVDSRFLKALPTLPSLSAPSVKKWGGKSKVVDANIGDIRRVALNPDIWVLVGETGLQQVKYTTARALGGDVNTPYIQTAEWANSHHVKIFDDSGFPDSIPHWAQGNVVCYTASTGGVFLRTYQTLPPVFTNTVTPTVQGVYVTPLTVGVWAKVERSTTVASAQVGEVYIAPDGTYYAIGHGEENQNIPAMLGLEHQHSIPEYMLPLLVKGDTLSPQAAQQTTQTQQ